MYPCTFNPLDLQVKYTKTPAFKCTKCSRVQECTVIGTGSESIICVMHENTKATFGKCLFERSQSSLAAVAEGAFAEFIDCKLAETVGGVGVELSGAGSRLEAERCTIERCCRCVLYIHSGALRFVCFWLCSSLPVVAAGGTCDTESVRKSCTALPVLFVPFECMQVFHALQCFVFKQVQALIPLFWFYLWVLVRCEGPRLHPSRPYI